MDRWYAWTLKMVPTCDAQIKHYGVGELLVATVEDQHAMNHPRKATGIIPLHCEQTISPRLSKTSYIFPLKTVCLSKLVENHGEYLWNKQKALKNKILCLVVCLTWAVSLSGAPSIHVLCWLCGGYVSSCKMSCDKDVEFPYEKPWMSIQMFDIIWLKPIYSWWFQHII